MTSQKSLSENTAARRAPLPLFADTLTRDWPHFLLYFLIFFFACPIPLLLSANNSGGSINAFSNAVESIGIITTVAACVIGIFAGNSSLTWLNGRVPTNFYHSLPVRREQNFFTVTLVRVIYAAAAVLVNFSLELVIAAANGRLADCAESIVTYAGWAMMCFFLYYTVTLLASVLSGTSGVRTVMSIVNLFLLLGVYSSFMYIIFYSAPNIDTDYYFSLNVIQSICPPVRLFTLYDNPFKYTEIIAYIVESVLIYASALFLYLRRKSERSDTPIVFPWAAEILKYSLMFIATLYCGFMFVSIGDNDGWLFFGFAVGATLTFMLVNTILYKNAKMMFHRAWGLLVYFAAFVVLFTVVGYDHIGMNDYVPAPSAVSSVTVQIDGLEVTFENEEVIAGFCELYKKEYTAADNRTDAATVADSVESASYFDFDSTTYSAPLLRFEAVFHTKLNVPVAKIVRGISRSDAKELLAAIADSDEFESAYNDAMNRQGSSISGISLTAPDRYGTILDCWINSSNDSAASLNKVLYGGDTYHDVSFESFQKTAVGSITLYLSQAYSSYASSTVYIYADDDAFFDRLPALNSSSYNNYSFKNDIDFYTDIAACITGATVYDNETEEKTIYTDAASIRALLEACASFSTSMSNISDLTVTDDRYVVLFETTVDYGSDYEEKYGEEAVEEDYSYTKQVTFSSFMLDGAVPSFITD